MIDGTMSLDNRNIGSYKHKILGYPLYKDNYVKKVRVKPNVTLARKTFIVKYNVAASMIIGLYEIYVH